MSEIILDDIDKFVMMASDFAEDINMFWTKEQQKQYDELYKKITSALKLLEVVKEQQKEHSGGGYTCDCKFCLILRSLVDKSVK